MLKQSWIRKLFTRPVTRTIRKTPPRSRLELETLEERLAPAVFTVNNPTDTPVAGQTDLRQAITEANSTAGANTITFDSTVFATPQTITLGGTQLTLTNTTGLQTITGPAAGVTVSGNNASRVFQIDASVKASISGLTITGGSVSGGSGAARNGGGVLNYGNLTLTNATVSGNTASAGGGIYNANTGSRATITNTTISGNTATAGNGSGGVGQTGSTVELMDCTISGNTGGGVGAYVSTLRMDDCTVSGNTGGGLLIGLGSTTLTNVTVTGNTTTGNGGGINLRDGNSPFTMINCTISVNTASTGGGFYAYDSGGYTGLVTVGNTIIAGNTATTSPDVYGTIFSSQGNNLIGKTDGSSGWVASDLTGTIAAPLNPQLGALANNGGPTQTMALLAGSPAINGGSNTLATSAGLTTDQRGATRINNGTVDIGAYEFQTLYWDPGLTATGTGSGGTGTWNTSTANWFNGSADQTWNNTFSPVAVFAGTAGTVTLGTGITASALTFNTTGYTVTGNTLTLAGGTGAVSVGSGVTDTISSVVAGSTGLTLSGGGTLVLTAANSYSGTTTISAGTLQVGNGGTTGSLGTGAVTDNAVLLIDLSTSINVTNAISGSGTLNLTSTGGAILQSSAITVASVVASASTGITLTNAGNTVSTFNATNTTSGNVSLTDTSGTLAITGISETGGTVTVNNTGSINITGTVSAAGGNAVNLTASGALSESGSGLISTTGTLTTSSATGTSLGGANAVGTFNATNSTSGNISLTNAMATLTVPSLAEVAGGSVTISNTGATSFSGALNGTYHLSVSSSGTTTFTAAVGSNTALTTLSVTGGTTDINGGGVTTTGGQTYGNAVVLGANSTLISTASGNITFASSVDGPFTLIVNTADTTTFTAAVGSNWALPTVKVTGGTTDINGGGVTTISGQTYGNAVVLGANATLTSTASGNILFAGTVDGPGALTVNTAGSTTFTGTVGGGSPLAMLTTDQPGQTILGASVTTTGDLTINDPLTLTANVTLIDAAATGAGITLGTVNSDSASQRVLTIQTNLNVSTGTIDSHVTYQRELLTGLMIVVTPNISVVNVSSIAVPVSVATTTNSTFQNVIVTGTPVAPSTGTLVVQSTAAPAAPTSVDLTKDMMPVMVTVASSTSSVVVTGDPVNNTFMMTGTQGNNVTFQGGTGLNLFVPNPTGGFNITLVDPAGSTNTIDLSKVYLPTIIGDKSTGSTVQIGATLDFSQNSGQKQLVFNTAVDNPDIGSLVDPSLLTSNSTDSLSLVGTFPEVIAGSGATLYAAPSRSATKPGTAFILTGSGNTVYAAPGSSVVAFSGGNQVIESSASTSQASSVLAASSGLATSYLALNTNSQQAYLQENATAFAAYLADNSANLQAFLNANSTVLAQYITSSSSNEQAYLQQNTSTIAQYLATNSMAEQAYLQQNGTTVAAYIAGSAAGQSAFLQQNAGAVAQYIATNVAGQQAFLQTNATDVAQYIASSSTNQMAYLGSGSAALNAFLSSNSTANQAYLSGGVTGLQSYVAANPTVLQSYLQNNPTALSQYIAGNNSVLQAYLSGSPTTLAQYLANSPSATQAYLAANTTAVSQYITGSSGGQQAYLAQNDTAVAQYIAGTPANQQAFLTQDSAGLTAYIAGSAAGQQAYLANNAGGVGAYVTTNTSALSAFLSTNSAAASAYLSGGTAGLQSYLATNPNALQSFLGGNPTVLQQYLLSNPGALSQYVSGDPTVLQQYLTSSPTVVQGYLSSEPGALQAYLTQNATTASAFLTSNEATEQAYVASDAAGISAYLIGNSVTLSAFLSSNPTANQGYVAGGSAALQAYLETNPGVLQQYIGGNPTLLQQYVAAEPAGLQAYLTANPAVLTQYLESSPTVLAQYVAGNPATLQQYLNGSPTALAQYLASSPNAQQAYLNQNSSAVAQYIVGSAAGQTAYLAGNGASVAAYISGNNGALSAFEASSGYAAYLSSGSTSVQAYLAQNGAALQSFISSDPTVLQSYLTASPSVLQSYLSGNSSALSAYVTQNAASVAQYVAGNPISAQAYLGSSSTAQSAFLASNSAANQAYVQGGSAGLQAYLTNNPTALSQYLANNATALTQYLSGAPATTQQYAASSAAAQQAYLQANAPSISAYLTGNPTALNAFLGGNPTANQAFLNGGSAGLQAYLTNNPGTLQQYLAGNSTLLQQYLNSNPTNLSQYLASTPTTLSQYIAGSPGTLQQYLAGSSTTLQQYVAGNPAVLQQYLASSPSVLSQYIADNPATLQQYLASNPNTLSAYITANPTVLQQYLSGSPAVLAQYLASSPTGTQSYLEQNAASVAQYISANTTAQQAYLQQNTANVAQFIAGNSTNQQAYLAQNTTAVAAYLTSNMAAESAFLTGNSAGVTAYIGGNPGAVSAFEAANPGSASYLGTGGAGLQAYLNANPNALQAYISANPTVLQSYLTSSPSVLQSYLSGNSSALSAYLVQNAPAVGQYIASNPISQAAYLAADQAGVSAYITGNAAALSAFETAYPGATAYLQTGGAGLQAFVQASPTDLQAFISGNPTVLQQYLAGNPAALQQYLASNPVTVAQYLAGSAAVQQSYLAANAAGISAYLAANPSQLSAFLASSTAADQAYVAGGSAGLAAFLAGNPGTLQQYLAGNSALLQGYLASDPTVLAQYLAGNTTTLQQYIAGNSAVLAQYLAGSPTVLAQYIAANPTTLQQYLTASPAVLQQYLSGSPAALTAYLTQNAPAVAQFIASNPISEQSWLQSDSAGVTAYLLGNSTDLSAFLGNNSAANQAYVAGGVPGLQAYLTTNPAALQQYLASNPSVLQQYLTGDPAMLQQYLSSSSISVAQYLTGNAAAQQAYLQANAAGISAYLVANPTVLNAFLASNTAANSAYVSGGSAGLQAYLASNPGALQAYIAGNTALLQGYLTSSPTILAQYLGSSPTILSQYIADNPSALQTYLSGSPTVLQQFLTSDPAALLTCLTSNPAVLQQFISSDPAVLQQFLTTDPALLQTFLGTNATNVQQFLTASQLNSLRVNVTLPGTGNEASGGLLSNFNIGGGLFTENLTPAQLQIVSQAAAAGLSANAYQLNVTVGGNGSTIVGGVLGNFTATGSASNFIIEDPTQLGLTTSTTAGLSGGTFNGDGSNDTFSFVGGGSADNNFGNVTLTEPAGATGDTVDFSGFQGGGVHLNLNASGPQQVNPKLTLTLPAGNAVTNALGSPASDTIVGNGSSDILQGARPSDPNPYAVAAVPPSSFQGNVTADPNPYAASGTMLPTNYPVEWVYLDFLPANPTTNPAFVLLPGETEHNYTTAQQQAVLTGLEKIYAAFPDIQFTTTPPSTGSYATVYFNSTPLQPGTAVSSITITNGGSGYTSAPTVTFSAPPTGGTTATGTANLTNGVVTSITITNPGSGYASPPAVTFSAPPSGGTTAVATAAITIPSPGGLSSEVDFGNLNLNTTVQVDVNGFLGTGSGQVPDDAAGADFVSLSITISAHEVGHTLGLEHMDALGPIGFGISSPPGAAEFYPTYTGLVGAFATQDDVMASPASVGSSLANAADGQAQFGARDAIGLAFITDGTTVASNGSAAVPAADAADVVPPTVAAASTDQSVTIDSFDTNAMTTVNAQPVSLYTLNVPDSITSGFGAGMNFAVSAVNIDGYLGGTQVVTDANGNPVIAPANPANTATPIGMSDYTLGSSAFTQSAPDYYSITGQAGQLMSFQAISASIPSIKDPFDTVLTVYGPNGQIVAHNDDQFEPSDSSIFDVTLPATGTYTVEVNAYNNNQSDSVFLDPTSSNYNPAAYYGAEHGTFELFMYTFAASNITTGNDTIFSAAPVLSLTARPAASTNSTSAAFSFAVSNSVTPNSSPTFDVSLDGSPFTPTSGPQVSYANLSQGAHTFQVENVDANGNVQTSASYTWIIDTTPPTVSITAAPPATSASTTASFSLTGSDNVTAANNLVFEVSLDDSAFAPTATNSVTYTGLSNATHTFHVEDIDQAGNVSAVASYSWTVNTTPPTVGQGTATVTVSDTSGTYNGSAFPAMATVNGAASLEGVIPTLDYQRVNSDGSLTELGPIAPIAAGNYQAEAVFAGSTDYASASSTTTFTISPAALTITVGNQTKVYGAALPALTANYSGFVTGDTVASLTAAPTLTTTATGNSAVGTYAITASGAVDSNYTITYVAGTLTVTPASLTITANNQTMYFGGSVPALTANYTGFVNGDTSASLPTQPTLSTVPANSAVGTYAITASGPAVDGNYAVTYVGGTLGVQQPPLIIAAVNQTMVYGGTFPTLTASYTGFVNGDTAASLTTQPTFSVTDANGNPVTASSSVGTWFITVSGAMDSNYSIQYVVGTLTITPAPLTVTLPAETQVYGSPAPAPTPVYSGLVNGDTANSFSATPPKLTPSTRTTSKVGNNYTNTASGIVDPNYTITYVAGPLTVVAATPTVSVTDAGGTWNGTAFGVTAATVTGVAGDGTLASLTTDSGTLSFTYVGINGTNYASSTTAPVNAGSYEVFADYTSDNTNYTNAVGSRDFTISPAQPTVTWASPSAINYGTALSTTQLDATANVAGSFAYTPAAGTMLGAGTQTLSVTFTPTDMTDYTTATKTVQIVVNPGTTTTTTVTASANTVNYNQALTFTAAVAASSGSTTPTGSVAFYDTTTSTDLGSISLSSGRATLTTKTLPLGTQTITATYSGSSGFATSYGTTTVTVTVTSITAAYILDSSAAAALTLSGNADLQVAGLVDVNSNASTAISASGNAIISAGSIQVVGRVSSSGNAHLSPAPVTGSTAFTDPLASLAAPSTTRLTNYGAFSLSGNSSGTINPGLYTSIQVSGNAKLIMNAGVYLIAGGGFSVTGNAAVSGSGVMIFNAGSNYATNGAPGGTFASVNLSGNGNISLTAPTSGTYDGILLFQSRDNTRALSLSGNGLVIPGGLIYAPAAQLVLSGNGQFQGSSIVDTLNISGNSIFNTLAGNSDLAYSPAQIRTAYGVNNLSYDGTGQTVAIVEAYDSPTLIQDLDTFDQQFSLTTGGPSIYDLYGSAAAFLSVVNQQGQTSALPTTDPAGAGTSNWEMEAALDVEWVHALAPGANIVVVEASSQSMPDLMASVQTAAALPGVSVVSMSWGLPEGVSVTAQDEALYDTFLTTPAGHQGVTFVTSTGDYGMNDPEYPAFSPNVVAVGGTSLQLNADNSYLSESAWGNGGNTNGGTLIGSGGGASLSESEPSYQLAVQSTGYRTTPDVSFVADPSTGVWIADTWNLPASNPWAIVGGTSLSAPAWAGLFALVNQGRADAGQATLNSSSPTEATAALYNVSETDFHDITSGNSGFAASAGYDLATGLGTPEANLLIPDLINYQGQVASHRTVTVTAAMVSAAVQANTSSENNSMTYNTVNVFNGQSMMALALGHGLSTEAASAQPATHVTDSSPTGQSIALATTPVVTQTATPSVGSAAAATDSSQLPVLSCQSLLTTENWQLRTINGLVPAGGNLAPVEPASGSVPVGNVALRSTATTEAVGNVTERGAVANPAIVRSVVVGFETPIDSQAASDLSAFIAPAAAGSGDDDPGDAVISGSAGALGHSGGDVLIGGSGIDMQIGGRGRNLMVGGFGCNSATAQAHDQEQAIETVMDGDGVFVSLDDGFANLCARDILTDIAMANCLSSGAEE